MKYLHILIAVNFTVTLLLAPASSRADLIWSWSFDQTEYHVKPTDPIIVNATLFNDPSSTQDIENMGFGASFTGDLQKTFHFTFGPTGNSSDFGLEFIGLVLAPGDSFPFVFGLLKPISGVAPEGVYPADLASMTLVPPAADPEMQFSTNTFSITVANHVNPPPPVPEPATWWLFGAGLLGCLGIRRARKGDTRDICEK